ncbi:hypothetical protein HY412_02525 [Candidatus Kaiserbacteria bacterium]|nr:hypothetical protein [Candidatus Kaiserbacteria bacterium]
MSAVVISLFLITVLCVATIVAIKVKSYNLAIAFSVLSLVYSSFFIVAVPPEHFTLVDGKPVAIATPTALVAPPMPPITERGQGLW